jgi:hypothetical protein
MRLTDDDIMKLINKANSLYAHQDYSGHDVMQASQDVLLLIADLREARAVIEKIDSAIPEMRHCDKCGDDSYDANLWDVIDEINGIITDSGIKGEGE